MKQAVTPIDNDEKEGPVVQMGGDESLEEEQQDRYDRQLEHDHQSALLFLVHPELEEHYHKYAQLPTRKAKTAYVKGVEKAAVATANKCMNNYKDTFPGLDTSTYVDTLALLFLASAGKLEVPLIRKVWCDNRFKRYSMKTIRGGKTIPGTLKYWMAARKFKKGKYDAAMKIHDMIVVDHVSVGEWTDEMSCKLYNKGVIEGEDLRHYDVDKLREFFKHYKETSSGIKYKWLKDNLQLFKRRGGQPYNVIRIPGVPGGSHNRRHNRT